MEYVYQLSLNIHALVFALCGSYSTLPGRWGLTWVILEGCSGAGIAQFCGL
jgi:hypothetical protein